MSKRAIQTDAAPKAIGPYSQAVDIGDLIFISGQIPLDPDTMEVVGTDIQEQTDRVMKNIDAILQKASLGFSDVVKFTIYLTDLNDFDVLNQTYAKYLAEPYPARATVEVSKLPKGVKVEIDVIAKR